MNVILSSVEWQFALVYLDDIVVLSKTFEKHIDHVRKVLLLLYNAGATLKFEERNFPTRKIRLFRRCYST